MYTDSGVSRIYLLYHPFFDVLIKQYNTSIIIKLLIAPDEKILNFKIMRIPPPPIPSYPPSYPHPLNFPEIIL